MTEKEFNEHVQWYKDKRGPDFDYDRNWRDDILLRDRAKELGYTIEYGRTFGDSLVFKKGSKIIWHCVRFLKEELVWACADLVDGRYGNQRYRESLSEVLEKEA